MNPILDRMERFIINKWTNVSIFMMFKTSFGTWLYDENSTIMLVIALPSFAIPLEIYVANPNGPRLIRSYFEMENEGAAPDIVYVYIREDLIDKLMDIHPTYEPIDLDLNPADEDWLDSLTEGL